MRSAKSRAEDASPQQPRKLLLWTAVASLIFGLIGFGEILEDQARVLRNFLHPTSASGDIVFVAIDDASLGKIGAWPWSRARHAQLIDAVSKAGARKIFVETSHEGPTDAQNDQAFADALARAGRVVLTARARIGTREGSQAAGLPMPLFARHADVASKSLFYNYQNAVWQLPYSADVDDRLLPSLSAVIAGKQNRQVGD